MDSQIHSLVSRGFVVRFFLAVLIAFAVALPAQAASVPRKFAGIVVDAKSGKVLYESSADAARYPASVTKVMTLYVLFQELAAGNIKLSDKMVVSKHAAAAVPTKLGLKAGSKITVENAIKALVTLSANDMARVIAEHISGSESGFAKRMTATAKGLGMKSTTYRNASGLPDSKQVTTVRDQAILGIAIYQHFPKLYAYFQTKSFSYGKRTYGNHNRLLGSNNVDGIKTGYTRASGYNLLTAARDGDQHVVVVGFGFDSSAARDAKVRELVKKYFSKGRKGDYLSVAMIPQPGRKGALVQVAEAETPTSVTPMPYPAFRLKEAQLSMPDPAAVKAQLENPVIVANLETPLPANRAIEAANNVGSETATVYPADRPDDVIGAWISDTYTLGAAPTALGETPASTPLLPPVEIGKEGQPIDLMTSGSVTAKVASVEEQPQPAKLTAATSGWVVQIGAAPSESGARSLLGEAAETIDGLTSFQPFVEKFVKDGQTFYRARFGGFGGRDDAAAMCSQLKKAKMSCLAMQS